MDNHPRRKNLVEIVSTLALAVRAALSLGVLAAIVWAIWPLLSS
ncbi:hypothetical protein [Hylemonella gracilis]|nr:hypothetical protein [Hylemonella gracilis]